MSRTFEILRSEQIRAATLSPSKRGPANRAEVDTNASVENAIRSLTQHLFVLQSPDAHAPKAVAFSGVDEGAGCSWVCARAGEALAAQSSGRVCVVDANVLNPSLHHQFRVENVRGFADAIADSEPMEKFVRRTWSDRLWLICAGSAPNGAPDPARLRGRIAELREDFDYLLIDTPPLSRHADAALLGLLSDGVVLVIGSDSTRREAARAAKESLEATGAHVLGAVLNRRAYPIPAAIYRRL